MLNIMRYIILCGMFSKNVVFYIYQNITLMLSCELPDILNGKYLTSDKKNNDSVGCSCFSVIKSLSDNVIHETNFIAWVLYAKISNSHDEDIKSASCEYTHEIVCIIWETIKCCKISFVRRKEVCQYKMKMFKGH